MKDGKGYFVRLACAAVLGLALLAAFNIAIDPYQLLDTPARVGLNAKKTEIFFHLGTTKTYQFYADDARGLILGSSRAGRAIDPHHTSLRDHRFYNFATPGVTPRLDYLKLRAAIATGSVTRVIYCVDFFTFNSFYTIPADYLEEFGNRMSLRKSLWRSPTFMRQAMVDFAGSFWAYNTSRDSIRTLRNQAAAEAGSLQYTVLHEGGMWEVVAPSNRRLLPAYKSAENTYLRETWFPANARRFSINSAEAGPNRAFNDFAALLSLAQSKGIETTIVILPVHARLLEVLYYAGLWDSFEYWKTQLVAINDRIARSQARPPFAVWDFNGYYPITSEAISRTPDARPLQWFYDSAHASVDMGNRILEIIAAGEQGEFGGRIDAGNIDQWLQTQRDARDAYRRANQQLSEQLRRNVNNIRRQSPWEIAPVPRSELVVDEFTDTEHSH